MADDRTGRGVGDAGIDLFRNENCAHRRIAGGQPLCDRHQIGRDALRLTGEHRSRAPEAGDHLIRDKQDAEFARSLAHRLQPADRRHNHAARPLDWFAEEGRDILCAQFADLGAQGGDRGGDHRSISAACRVAVGIGRGNVMLIGVRQIEIVVEHRKGGQPRTKRGRAVVSLLKRDELVLRGAPCHIIVVGDEADGTVHRIRAALGEIDTGQPLGSEFRKPCCESNCGFGTESKIAGGIGKLSHLRRRRLHHALMSIANVDAPQPGEGIQQLFAGGVPQEHAFGACQHRNAFRLMRAIGAHGMDEMLAIERDERICKHEHFSF